MQREGTILNVVEKIRQSLDLSEIFQATTEELRLTLKCDRVTLYRFHHDWSGDFVAESLIEGLTPVLGSHLENNWTDTCLQETQGGRYSQNQTMVVEDLEKTDFSDCHRQLYHQIQARAFCITPIFQGKQLWGLLASYQNYRPRQWKEGEIRLIVQTATQLGISIAQVDLFTQIQNQSLLLQQAKEAAEAANQAKSAFIAHTSHELRTPLNAILGFAQILKREPTNPVQQQRGVEVIQQSGQHLLTLINDILYIAKIEAGKLNLELRDFILPSFLDNLASMIRVRCHQKNVGFEHQFAEDLPKLVRGDETRLRQLLLNLLSNAVKFTDTGKVTFKVAYLQDFSPEPTDINPLPLTKEKKIRFYIEDTGIGIPPDKITDIFAPFSQINPHSSNQEGTGLGLTISKNLAEQMGSQIYLKSTLGEGSAFWFDLDFPRGETPMAMGNSHDSNLNITGYTGQKRQILVVDDLDNNREVLVNFLHPLGFHVLEASSGEAAIALAHEHHPDGILLDLVMPEMDGWEVTRRLREEPLFQELPIVIVSASTLPADESQCYQAGANEFLPKPIGFGQLLRIIEKYLQLEWITADGTTLSLLNQPLLAPPVDAVDENPPVESLVIPSQEKLTQLLNLVMVGDIRGALSQVNDWQENEPQLTDFTQQVTQLAETCQLKKLKEFIRQHQVK